nr:uncharacterized protein LOC105472549 [Macaca nemestrina]XP_011724220.1 uncharacterized protein LOC105472549 [Macaca nemestrina]XP_011724221.1 uncharacterized protein LOC105472549 [Macaca nemestrina]XP_011724222.1 uncharacterized protein LOC105472549 [Macaca nemestrina]XP_011724223.1 uncharacterized protein LOC105472549 [Macaca nemestrina]
MEESRGQYTVAVPAVPAARLKTERPAERRWCRAGTPPEDALRPLPGHPLPWSGQHHRVGGNHNLPAPANLDTEASRPGTAKGGLDTRTFGIHACSPFSLLSPQSSPLKTAHHGQGFIQQPELGAVVTQCQVGTGSLLVTRSLCRENWDTPASLLARVGLPLFPTGNVQARPGHGGLLCSQRPGCPGPSVSYVATASSLCPSHVYPGCTHASAPYPPTVPRQHGSLPSTCGHSPTSGTTTSSSSPAAPPLPSPIAGGREAPGASPAPSEEPGRQSLFREQQTHASLKQE